MKKQLISLSALFLTAIIFLIYGCKEKMPLVDDLSNKEYSLVDQDSNKVEFPQMAKGKITVTGYIFTNCPDICPLTTNNMHRIQERVKKENIKGVEFVTISFDPEFDTPNILKKYAEVRNLDLSNWTFLTGSKTTIDSLIKEVGVFAVVNDSTVFKNGKKIYYYVHTDRIQLIDQDGKIRKNYHGSKINIDEIIADIKKLS